METITKCVLCGGELAPVEKVFTDRLKKDYQIYECKCCKAAYRVYLTGKA